MTKQIQDTSMNADMHKDMIEDAKEWAVKAFDNENNERAIASFIKKEFEKKYTPGIWHCIVGKNFGSYVTHETKAYIYFYVGQMAVLTLYDYDPVFDFLGNGQFATVYKAVRRITSNNLLQGEEVALKVISKRQLDSEKALKDIINEVEILRRLKHRHCCVLREVLQSEYDVFIVLQLVQDAGELFQVISSIQLSEECAATITKQILRALRYMHVERRVVHRDLKPENILIGPKSADSSGMKSEKIKITVVDFGLAKYIGSNQRRRIHAMSMKNIYHPPTAAETQGMNRSPYNSSGTGQKTQFPTMQFPSNSSFESIESVGSHRDSPILTTPVGSLKYCAPETLRAGAGPRQTTRGDMTKLDLYSVGITSYVMLCGQMPFSGKSKGNLATQMEAGPKFQHSQWERVSAEAKDFVAKLLSPNPKERPTTEEALKHPWILNMGYPDEDDKSVLGANKMTKSNSVVCFDQICSNRDDLSHAYMAIMETEELEEGFAVEPFKETQQHLEEGGAPVVNIANRMDGEEKAGSWFSAFSTHQPTNAVNSPKENNSCTLVEQTAVESSASLEN